MRKGIRPAAAAIVLLASGAAFVVSPPRGVAADTTVDMKGNTSDDTSAWRFAPEEITVPVGATVVWVNKSNQPHTATAENSAFKSEYLNQGETFKFTATTPGDIKYYCEPHRSLGMVGVIHVTGSTGPTATTTATTAPSTVTSPTSATTATTAPGGASTTTTNAGGATTTTTSSGGATTTTAPATNAATTPTSSADQSATTSTTAPAASNGESAEGAGGGGHRKTDSGDSSPIGIAFAAVATLLLAGVSAKLLASKGH